jgi:hypothetical protein
VEKTGEKRPWKSQERFPLSHSFNNNKLDDRDHFQQNAKTSVASLRGLIGSSRNIDWHHSGMLIAFIGIPTLLLDVVVPFRRILHDLASFLERGNSRHPTALQPRLGLTYTTSGFIPGGSGPASA